MKTTRLSLLLAGFVSVAAGCQPEEPTPTATALPGSREAALDGQVGTWSTHASMSIARAGHTATLINISGNVLATSGGTAEVYNPYDEVWRPTPPMLALRENPSATWIQATGKVLVAGGVGPSVTYHSSAELYDESTNTWTATGSMLTARSRHTATMLDSGKVLVTGGSVSRWETSAAELYDPATGTWSATGSMNMPRATHTATKLYSGKVLVVGGYFFPYGDHATAEIYDPATGTWTRTAGMMSRTRREHVALRLYSGLVLIVGGSTYGDNSAELYDPYNDIWSMAPSLPFALGSSRYLSATMLYTGEVLVVDGVTGASALFDENANAWIPAGQGQSRKGHTATLLHTGEILVTGGADNATGATLSSTLQYTH